MMMMMMVLPVRHLPNVTLYDSFFFSFQSTLLENMSTFVKSPTKRHSLWLTLLPFSINFTLRNVNYIRILHQSDSNNKQIQSILVISNLVNGISPALCSLIEVMMMMMMVLPVRHRPNFTQSLLDKHQSDSYSSIMSLLTLLNPTLLSHLIQNWFRFYKHWSLIPAL